MQTTPISPSQLILPVLSLLVAMLGLLTPVWTSKRQAKTAHRLMLGPMRQAWITKLREKLAVLVGRASLYAFTGQNPGNAEKSFTELVEIQQEIELLINPREKDHRDLVGAIEVMMKSYANHAPKEEFHKEQRAVVTLAQTIFKTEWDRVKSEE